MVRKFLTFFLLLSLSSCALKSRKEQSNLRELFAQKEFDKALSFLEKSSLKEKKNYLVYLMERGTLLYYQGKYFKASRVFVQANELVDKLYTKSIKEKLVSSIFNDNSETFYGPIFERSLLFYYQAMCFHRLAQKGEYETSKLVNGKQTVFIKKLSKDEKRKNFNRVRSTLIAWDSFFQEISRIKGAKTFQKYDLLAKQLAANLHESLNKRSDKEIALQLYKDAYQILLEIGPTQKIFNTEFENYSYNLKRVYSKKAKRSDLKRKKITHFFQLAKDHLIYKILSLSKKVRSYEYKNLLKKYKPSLNVMAKLKKKRSNISLIIEHGLISSLEAKDFSLNLSTAIDKIKDKNLKRAVNKIGVPILTYFALGPLGLGYVSHHGNVSIFSRHHAGDALTKEIGIEFELPFAKLPKQFNQYKISIYQNEKMIKEQVLIPISSLHDLRFISAQEMIESSFSKRSLRVGLKYIAAIVAAYGTYSKVKEKGGEIFAKPAALAQFLISQKAIKASEKADIRHWSSLPGLIFENDFNLKKGMYSVYFSEYDRLTKKMIKRVKLGPLSVNSQKKSVFTYRVF